MDSDDRNINLGPSEYVEIKRVRHKELVEAESNLEAAIERTESLMRLAEARGTALREVVAERDQLHQALSELVAALDRTHWSSWQTTAPFWKEFEAAQSAVAALPPPPAGEG